jgi:hypothetical protein
MSHLKKKRLVVQVRLYSREFQFKISEGAWVLEVNSSEEVASTVI